MGQESQSDWRAQPEEKEQHASMAEMGCAGSTASGATPDPAGRQNNSLSCNSSSAGNRACRLTVHILAAKGLKDGKDAIFKLQVEHAVRRSQSVKATPKLAEEQLVEVKQSFTFQVQEPDRAVLQVQVAGKGILGVEAYLGHIPGISISQLLQNPQAAQPTWHNLASRDGTGSMPGQILVHAVAAIAEAQQSVTALVGSWNVGNSRPPDDLSAWIPPDSSHHIVAIGCQECEYPAKPPFSDCGSDWLAGLASHLGRRYKLLQAVSRSQIRVAVFIREDVQAAVTEVLAGTEATGVGHVVANKGGVCICFKFWDTSVCFINSHFAAHSGQSDARNGNFREICGELRVGVAGMDVVNQFHHVFWLGDLNYRLDFGEGKAVWSSVVRNIQAGRFEELLRRDELLRDKAAGKVFHGFQEGAIFFAPTFKVRKQHLADYDAKRIPAWCDRILWKDMAGCEARLIFYRSAPQISSSDHKPVVASFSFSAHALPVATAEEGGGGERWNIVFQELRARQLRPSDVNGLSDPYVSFVGPVLVQQVHSKVKPQTLNPVWNVEHDVPPLVLNVMPLERLRKQFLMLRLLDRDYASADDILAYGTIPLADLVEAYQSNPARLAAFRVDLTFRGLPAGVLEGTMQLSFQKSLTSKKKSILKSELTELTLGLRDSIFKNMVETRHVSI